MKRNFYTHEDNLPFKIFVINSNFLYALLDPPLNATLAVFVCPETVSPNRCVSFQSKELNLQLYGPLFTTYTDGKFKQMLLSYFPF